MRREMHRDEYLDLLKGLGIILVYLGHTFFSGSLLFRVIFFVHMPLFFLVSGILFNPERYQSVGAILKKTFESLIIPYFFFAAVANVVKYDIQSYLWQTCLLGQLYGLFIRGDCIWALWFLVCLGSVRISYYVVYRLGGERTLLSKVALVLICLICAEGSMRYLYPCRKLIPLMASSVPAALFFFAIGRYLRQCIDFWHAFEARPILTFTVFVICCFAMVISVKQFAIRTFDLRQGVFSVAGLLPSFCGLMALGSFVVLLRSYFPDSIRGGVGFLGTYSLIFFAMEQNVSHLYSVALRWSGFDVPEVFYGVKGMAIIKMGRVVFCLMTVAAFVPIINRILIGLEKRCQMLLAMNNKS